MSEIAGACLSQFHDDANSFELLLAFADCREVGFKLSRSTAQTIAEEFSKEFGLRHTDVPLQSSSVYWQVEEYKIWKGIDPEKPVWSSLNFVSQKWDDMMDLCDFLRGNNPDIIVRVMKQDLSDVSAKSPMVSCCMCGKTRLSIIEGDGGQECQLSDGRWVCTPECWDRAVEQHVAPAPEPLSVGDVTAAEEAQMALCQLSWIEDGGKVHPRRIECIKKALNRLSKSGTYEKLSVAHFLSKTSVERELGRLKSGAHAHNVGALLTEAHPAETNMNPADFQLLDQLDLDNVPGGSRPVIESQGWEQAHRLSDTGLIAIESVGLGGRLHITRKGMKAVAAFKRGETAPAPQPHVKADRYVHVGYQWRARATVLDPWSPWRDGPCRHRCGGLDRCVNISQH